MDVREYADQMKISASARSLGIKYDNGWEHRAYSVTLDFGAFGGQVWRGVPYSMGMALSGGPDAAMVLDCLILDARFGDLSFEEFCDELGYDHDSRKAEATHKECFKTARKLRKILGDTEYERLVHSGEVESL